MADFVTKIRTADGDLPVDYNSLANLPDLSASGLGITVDSLGAAAAEHTHTFFSIGTSAPSDTKVLWIDTNDKW